MNCSHVTHVQQMGIYWCFAFLCLLTKPEKTKEDWTNLAKPKKP